MTLVRPIVFTLFFVSSNLNFNENGCSENWTAFLPPAFRISDPIWVKFGIGDLQVMLWAVYEFPENRRLKKKTPP